MAIPDIQALPAEYRRLLDLAQERFQVEILLLDELRGGRTGALLYLVSLSKPGAGDIRHLILKLDQVPQRGAADEIEKHRSALSLAPPDFAGRHIAEIAYEVKEGPHLAVFYAIAGQSLLQFRPLAHYTRQSQLETIFSATNDLLLNHWNAPHTFDRRVHPQVLLQRWLSYRLKPGGRIASFLEQRCCIDAGTPGFVIRGEVYPNPLAYAQNPASWSRARPIDVLTGCQHGDLNTRNILVRFAPDGRQLDGYYLIDFALFKGGMPLLFDQRYLEMSYLIAELEQSGLDLWVDLTTHFAREDTPDPEHVPVSLVGACAVLNAGRRAFRAWIEASHTSLGDDLWAQFWLAGTAAGLNFCNKQACRDRERLAGLIYAAAHLKHFCTQFGVASPAEVKLLFDNAQTWEAARPTRGTSAAPGLPAVRAILPGGSPPEHDTTFVGRRREIAEIGKLLDANRLITLNGPGGIGKTRLALAVAEESRARYLDGAFFVPLLAHDSPSAIVPAIAQVLGVNFLEGRPPQAQLLDALRPRQLLLVLDNLEHLLREEKAEATLALVEALLAASPKLALLVTSRELLRLPQEQPYLVEGLPLGPGPEQASLSKESADRTQISELDDDSAAQLFRLRARRVQPANPLDSEEDLALIRALCQTVAGMPLAIELAAAQLRLLPLPEIVAGIERSLDVLDTSLRGRSNRHRSMRAVFETSWSSLEPVERLIFARLSVFLGGFTLEAASQVAGAGIHELTILADKSLIGVGGDGRFSQHPLVQRFASHKLAEEPDEQARTQECHHRYYRTLAAEAAGEWEREQNRPALEALHSEADNVRAAWRWALARRDWDAVSELTDALWTFHRIQGRLTEAMELVARAISEGSEGEPRPGGGRLAHWEGLLGYGNQWLSQLDAGARHFRRSLAALRWPVPESRRSAQVGLLRQLALQGLHRLVPPLFIGRRAHRQAAIDEAMVACTNLTMWAVIYNETLLGIYYQFLALNLAEAGGRPAWMASAYAAIAYMLLIGSARRVAAFYMRRAESCAAHECTDLSQTWTSFASGWYFFCRNEHDRARVQFELAAAAAGRLEQGWTQGNSLVGLLYLAYYLGQYRHSLQYVAQIRESSRLRGDLGFIGAANYWDAVVKLQWGRLEEAQAHLDQSAATPVAAMKPFDWMIVWAAQARVYLRQGRPDLAVREADKFTRLVDEAGVISHAMSIYPFTSAAEAYLAAWEAAGSRSQSRAGGSAGPERQAAEKACRNLEKAAHAFPYGRASGRLYRGCYEWLCGHPREAHRAWTESLAAAIELSFPYEKGLAHYEIGRHLPDGEVASGGLGRREHLERAAEIFARLEIPYELNLARAALGDQSLEVSPILEGLAEERGSHD
jgi:predicted ATPase